MKKLLFLSFIIAFISCQDKFEPNKFNGDWVNVDEDGSFASLPSIKFKKDSIYFIDDYTYTTKAKFTITQNKISCFFKNDTIINKFRFSSIDSTFLIGKNKYSFWEEYSDFSELTDYKLIGIKSKGIVTVDSLRRFESGFHIFKKNNDSLKLKFNDKITTNKKNVSLFVYRNHRNHFDISCNITYVGKNVKLKDLIDIYFELINSNNRATLLILDYDIKNNTYSGFLDKFNFWEEQIEEYSLKNNYPPLPPPAPEYFKVKYLKKYSPKIIIINSSNNFNQLENIDPNNNYLISINPEMEIETYLRLKEKIIEIKRKEKIRIKTEFIL